MDAKADSVVFPADGRHMVFADISAEDNFLVKGQSFDLQRFLGDADLAKRYDLPLFVGFNRRFDPSFASLAAGVQACLLYTSPSPRDGLLSRMPSSA